jgi:hypothetical protein
MSNLHARLLQELTNASLSHVTAVTALTVLRFKQQ